MSIKLYALKSTLDLAKPYLIKRADDKLKDNKEYEFLKNLISWEEDHGDIADLLKGKKTKKEIVVDVVKEIVKEKLEDELSSETNDSEKTDAKDADEKTDDAEDLKSKLAQMSADELKSFIKDKGGKVHHNAKFETILEIALELFSK